MSTLLPTLIGWLQQYGYPALALSILIASAGVPLPISFVLLAAGAFSALGDFNIFLLLLIALSASVCGDSIGYLIGRFGGSKLLNWLSRQQRSRFVSTGTLARIEQSRAYFHQRGGWAIFLSRFLLSGLGGTVNLLAGAEFYPYPRFLLLDISGEFIGALIPLTLGYAFGASWEAIGDILAGVSGFITALAITLYVTMLLIRMVRRLLAGRARRLALQAGSKRIRLIEQEEPLIKYVEEHSDKPILADDARSS